MSRIQRKDFRMLGEMDQLQAEIRAGNAFPDFAEAHRDFPPTFKVRPSRRPLQGYAPPPLPAEALSNPPAHPSRSGAPASGLCLRHQAAPGLDGPSAVLLARCRTARNK